MSCSTGSDIVTDSAPDARWCGRLRGLYIPKEKFPSDGVFVLPLCDVCSRDKLADVSDIDSGAPRDVRSGRR